MENKPSTAALPDVVKERLLKAPIEKVWDVVSTAEGIATWFMPNDLQAQAGFRFHLNAGPFGQSACEVLEVDPPHRLSFKWDKDWIITFLLEEVEGGTKFTLVHGGWSEDAATSFGEKHSVVRERMSNGWVGIVQKLAEKVEV